MRAKLEAGKESAYLSKKLAAIWTDAPIKLNLKEVDGSKVDPARLQALLQKLQFRSLLRQLPEVMKVSLEDHAKAQESFDIELNIGKHALVKSDAELAKLKLAASPAMVVHSRAASKHGRQPQLLILSSEAKQTIVLDLEKLSRPAVKSFLDQHFSDKTSLIGYDLKYTLKILIELGVDLPPVGHDVLVGSFLINALLRARSLTELAIADLDYNGSPFEDLDKDELANRAAEIVGVLSALYEQQTKVLVSMPKIVKLARDIEWPVIPVIARMEYEGIQLDTKYLAKMSNQLDDMILKIEQEIYGHADQEFNIGSPAQLADILFTKLNLPTQGIKKGKTGYSTAASELDKLRPAHPIINLITSWREVTKLKNTYVDVMPKMVDEQSRLHTTYDLTVAQTGRLSSNDPNLQNIPVRTELGKQIRTAFVAGPGKMLISADYSQFELRLAAYLCADKELIDMFNRDIDVHTVTAAEIYGREEEDVTKNMRRDAKVVNFGVMYGLSAHGLVEATGMTYEQAKHFIEKYFEVRPKLLKYIEGIKEKATKDGYVENIFGRRRPTPDVQASNYMVREAGMRQAVNMPFQGSAADIMKLAMIAVDQKLSGKDCKILLQIHDSLILECPEKDAEKVAEVLKETMENVYKLPVKLTVDTSIGKNWGEL